MKISVITPSFNKGKFIEETILSVINQTYFKDNNVTVEHIIIDAGSTDETINILKKYNNNIIWISEPDKGQSDAINKGWKMATGDIIAYLNADDIYLPNTIDLISCFFIDNPNIYMIYGNGIITDENGNNSKVITCGDYNKKDLILCKDNIFQPSVFIRKEVYESVGDMDINLHLAMDLDYWIRIGNMYTKQCIKYFPVPLSSAKIYQDAKSSAMMHKYIEEYEYILDKFFKFESSEWAIPFKSEIYATVYTKGSLDYFHNKMFKKGIEYSFKALKTNPIICLYESISLILGFVLKLL